MEAEPVQRQTLVRGTGDGYVGTANFGQPGSTVVLEKPWWKILFVRVARIYFQTFSGLLVAQGIGVIDITHAVDTALGAQWNTFASLAFVSVMPTVVGAIQNVTEFLTKIDQTNPLFHA